MSLPRARGGPASFWATRWLARSWVRWVISDSPRGCSPPCQVTAEVVGEDAFVESGQLDESQQELRNFVNGVVKRKLTGVVDKRDAPAPKRRKRCKTYCLLMAINNMLKGAGLSGLSHFMIKLNADGTLQGDPFQMNCLAMATDSGPDCVAACHFLQYHRPCNVIWDWDLSHSINNGCKLALKCPLLVFGFLRCNV